MSVFGILDRRHRAGATSSPVVKFDSRSGRVFRIDRENVRRRVGPLGSGHHQDVQGSCGLRTSGIWLDRLPNGRRSGVRARPGWRAATAKADPERQERRPLHAEAVQGLRRRQAHPRACVVGSKAFLGGVEKLYLDYQAGAKDNPGKLPIVVLEDTVPVKTGSGDKSSTNYAPVFKITGWAPRGDLVFQPKNAPAASAAPRRQRRPAFDRIDPRRGTEGQGSGDGRRR
jgi:hypothetical protein